MRNTSGRATSFPSSQTAHYLRAAPSATPGIRRSISHYTCSTASASIPRWVPPFSQVRSITRSVWGVHQPASEFTSRVQRVWGAQGRCQGFGTSKHLRLHPPSPSTHLGAPPRLALSTTHRCTLELDSLPVPSITRSPLSQGSSRSSARHSTIAAASQRACQVRQRSRASIEVLSTRPLRDYPRVRCSCVVRLRSHQRHYTLKCSMLMPSNSAS